MNDLHKKIIDILYEIEPAVLLEDELDLFETQVLDSMGVLYLITELEKAYHIEIPMEQAEPENFSTVAHIEMFVGELIQKNG